MFFLKSEYLYLIKILFYFQLVSGSSVLYRVLLKQCLERNLFILVRYTQKPNTTPQICALVPQSMGEGNEGNVCVYLLKIRIYLKIQSEYFVFLIKIRILIFVCL